MKRQLILDTSVFVNPACAHMFGSSPTAALINFLEKAERAGDVEWLMPPSVYSELMHFADEKRIPKNLIALLHQRPPKKHDIRVPGIFIYALVNELRDRSDRGLRLAERHAREAMQTPVSTSLSAGDKQIRPDADVISRLRESYRRIMREGMLDSKADVDLLLLAYELNATLVTADQGLLTWAENWGVSILPVEQLSSLLEKKG